MQGAPKATWDRDRGTEIVSGNSEKVMTIEELAEYLKVSRSTLYKLAQEGKVPGQKVGRHWRFHRDIIDTWLAERSEPHPGGEAT